MDVPIPRKESKLFQVQDSQEVAANAEVPIPKRESKLFQASRASSPTARFVGFQSLKGNQNYSRGGHLKPFQDWIFKVPLRG